MIYFQENDFPGNKSTLFPAKLISLEINLIYFQEIHFPKIIFIFVVFSLLPLGIADHYFVIIILTSSSPPPPPSSSSSYPDPFRLKPIWQRIAQSM